jgi:hypothetical protein
MMALYRRPSATAAEGNRQIRVLAGFCFIGYAVTALVFAVLCACSLLGKANIKAMHPLDAAISILEFAPIFGIVATVMASALSMVIGAIIAKIMTKLFGTVPWSALILLIPLCGLVAGAQGILVLYGDDGNKWFLPGVLRMSIIQLPALVACVQWMRYAMRKYS